MLFNHSSARSMRASRHLVKRERDRERERQRDREIHREIHREILCLLFIVTIPQFLAGSEAFRTVDAAVKASCIRPADTGYFSG